MFLSMTGFASKTVSLDLNEKAKVSLSLELKTINTRFFEASCKLPSILSSLEIKIINRLKSNLFRGRAYFSIRILESDVSLTKVKPSIKLIEGYLNALNEIKGKFNLSGSLRISDVLNLPNLFLSQNIKIDAKLEKNILNAVDEVVDLLIKSRNREGLELKKDLEKRFIICAKKMALVKKRFNAFVKEKKTEIKKLLLEYDKTASDESKLKLDELYSVLNKIDVHEEIIRFESHLKNAKKVISDANSEKGKRLDFILQELLREANTTLAKCSDFNISSLGVDIKVEIEKVREQAQNVV